MTAAGTTAAMDSRAVPPSSLLGALGPALPRYFVKAIGAGDINASIGANVETRYQGTIDLSLSLTTNGTLIDNLFLYGWWSLVSTIFAMGAAAWVAGCFIEWGEIGGAVGGVLLYGLSETWSGPSSSTPEAFIWCFYWGWELSHSERSAPTSSRWLPRPATHHEHASWTPSPMPWRSAGREV